MHHVVRFKQFLYHPTRYFDRDNKNLMRALESHYKSSDKIHLEIERIVR